MGRASGPGLRGALWVSAQHARPLGATFIHLFCGCVACDEERIFPRLLFHARGCAASFVQRVCSGGRGSGDGGRETGVLSCL